MTYDPSIDHDDHLPEGPKDEPLSAKLRRLARLIHGTPDDVVKLTPQERARRARTEEAQESRLEPDLPAEESRRGRRERGGLMPRFRKKPVEIEAQQFFLAMAQWPDGVQREPGLGMPCFVVTAHGQRAYLADGDWIIPEPDGRGHYPCKPDIFEATYEPMEG